jgi:hypothetical protein
MSKWLQDFAFRIQTVGGRLHWQAWLQFLLRINCQFPVNKSGNFKPGKMSEDGIILFILSRMSFKNNFLEAYEHKSISLIYISIRSKERCGSADNLLSLHPAMTVVGICERITNTVYAF